MESYESDQVNISEELGLRAAVDQIADLNEGSQYSLTNTVKILLDEEAIGHPSHVLELPKDSDLLESSPIFGEVFGVIENHICSNQLNLFPLATICSISQEPRNEDIEISESIEKSEVLQIKLDASTPLVSEVKNELSYTECTIAVGNKGLVEEDEINSRPPQKHLASKEETPYWQRKKDLLYGLARQRVLKVSLVNISTRILRKCEICGMSLPAMRFSSHQESHTSEENGSSEDRTSTDTTTKDLSSSTSETSATTKAVKGGTKYVKKKIIPPPSKSSVRLKMKLQQKTKPHQCRFCEKRFVSASQCKSHENGHSEIMTSELLPSPRKKVKQSVGPPPEKPRKLETSHGKRGRPPKKKRLKIQRDMVQETVLPKIEVCKTCTNPIDNCNCKSESELPSGSLLQRNISNLRDKAPVLTKLNEAVKEIARIQQLQLQGMPVLKPKFESVEDDWSMDANNSDCGPPELEPEEEQEENVLTPTNSSGRTTPEGRLESSDTCQTCGEEVMRSALLEHVRNHLEKGQRDCSLCDYQGHSFKDLREHINKHYGLRPYECRFCDKNFSWETGLKKHLLASHEDRIPFKCSKCFLRFETHRERRRHELTHKDILKPGGRSPSGSGRLVRRTSLQDVRSPTRTMNKTSERYPRRRSLSVLPSFSSDEGETNSQGPPKSKIHKSGVDSEQELKKGTLYPIPEFAPIVKSRVLNSEFTPRRISNETEVKSKTESEIPTSDLQPLSRVPEFDLYSPMQMDNSSQFSSVQSNIEINYKLPSGAQELSHLPLSSPVKVSHPNKLSEHSRNGQSTDEGANIINGDPSINDDTSQQKQKNKKKLVSVEVHQAKPDPREFEKCKTCNKKIPMEELMAHIQGHLKPNQKKCDLCNYEATSAKLLPEHMNIHYILKPFQCNICKRRFAMKGYLRSHHQQVHVSSDSRRYVCNFCDKRFVRPCHRKAHEKGVHMREGHSTPSPSKTPVKETPQVSPNPKVEKSVKASPKLNSLTPTPTPQQPTASYPINSTPHVQNYNGSNAWTPTTQQEFGSLDNYHQGTQHGQNHGSIKQENNYWGQPEQSVGVHQMPPQLHNQNVNHDIKPNRVWEVQPNLVHPNNEFDLNGTGINPSLNQYANTQHSSHGLQNQNQSTREYSYGDHNSYNNQNYQDFNTTVMTPVVEYQYPSPPRNPNWSNGNSLTMASADPLNVNYPTYTTCTTAGPESNWPATDPYNIQSTPADQTGFHENAYTIPRPCIPLVDLWSELRHEELKLFPENAFGPSFSSSLTESSSIGLQQNSHGQGQSYNHHQPHGSTENVPLLAPPTLPIFDDLLGTCDDYAKGYFEGLPPSSPENLFETRVPRYSDLLSDEISEYAQDNSSSAHSLDDSEETSSTSAACQTCGQYFLKTEIIAHVRTHLEKGQRKCDVCQRTFSSSKSLGDHLPTHYQFKAHKCTVCFKSFSSKHSLKNHISCIHEGKKEAKCDICGKAFTLIFSLRRHLRRVHKINPKNGLGLAPSETPRSQSVKTYQPHGMTGKKKGRPRKKVASTSNQIIQSGRRLEDIISSVHQSELNLKSHTGQRVVSGSEIKECKVQLINIGKNKMTCGYCQATIMVMNLMSHRQNHKDPCHICGKPVQIEEMLHHGITHVKNLLCEICKWQARTRSQLWEHYNTHMGLKPLKCSACGAGFASRSSLRTHYIAKHTNVRPHDCNFCDRSFVQLSVRRLHEITHYGTNCPVCAEEFELKKDLLAHMKEFHTDEDIDNVGKRHSNANRRS